LALLGLAGTNISEGIYIISPADNTACQAPATIELSAYAVTAGEPISQVDYLHEGVVIGSATASPFKFDWTNVPAGTYTFTAQAAYGQGLTLTSPPVTVTVGAPPAPVSPVFATLIPALSPWKYWDNVAPVGLGWQRPDFEDSGWPASVARFGFGYDGERTQLTEGRITWYFRRWFTVTNPALFTQLLFQLARDDGAVVYLNGREVFRSNLPSGPVLADTLASATVNTPDETTYFETALAVAGSGLVPGDNLVAVELHQAAAASSDAGFDLQLIGFGTTEGRILLTAPRNGAALGPVDYLDLEAAVSPGEGVGITGIEFLINGSPLGESAAAPWRWQWGRPSFGPQRVSARAYLDNGGVLDSASVNVSVGYELISSNSVWKYLDDGSNLGTNWAQPAFDDRAWPAGYARFGYGAKGEITRVDYGDNPNARYITTYFRQTFFVPDDAVYTNLTCKLLRDDGAVVWLNGRELYRSNLPSPATVPVIAFDTLASGSVNGANEQTFFTTSIPVDGLPAGTNLVAVELHQITPGSTDLGFNFEMLGGGYRQALQLPQLGVALVDGNLELSWPDTSNDWHLLHTPDLGLGQWLPLDLPRQNQNGKTVVVVPAAQAGGFYRLVKSL
jgi:hypothetical protein